MEKINFNMAAQKKLSLLSVPTDTVTVHEISEEFNLPDYIPEVRRVLCVKSGVLPESKYLADKGNGATLDFGGTVTYLVIYTDDEGNLCSTPLSSSYEESLQITSNPREVIIDTSVDNTALRVNAPRKLTVKARLKSRIIGFEKSELEENIMPKSTADEIYLQRACKKIKTAEIFPISLKEIKIDDRFDMQGVKIIRPIWCDAELAITECKAQNKSVSVKGEGSVKCVCQCEDGCTVLTKSIRINEEIEAEESRAGDMASVRGKCISLAVANEINGEENQLFFDLSCDLEGTVSHNAEEYVTIDCYSTKCETEVSCKTLETYSSLKSHNSSFTVSETLKRKDNEMKEIIEIIANPVCEKTEIKGQKATVFGKIELNVIGECEEKENGEKEYICQAYDLPVRYDTDLGKIADECVIRSNFTVGKISGKYDGEKLYVACEVFLAQDIIEKSRTEVLDKAVIKNDKEIKNDASCVRVYFPTEGDTLWEIAKRYHTTVNKITQENEIEADTSELHKSILI